MYTFKLRNPNHLKINKNNAYFIPFGSRCASALICKYSQLRKFSLPFDWTIPLFPNKIKKIIENDFKNYLPDVRNKKFLNKYQIYLAHFNKDIEKGIQEYERRIVRFRNIMSEKNKKYYFVYSNEDYIYNEKYKEINFNQKIFKEMLILEKYLQKKYKNIDYCILYFNFFDFKIPKDSKIINIQLTQTEKNKNSNHFRYFCAEILTKLFGTELNKTSEKEVFNN